MSRRSPVLLVLLALASSAPAQVNGQPRARLALPLDSLQPVLRESVRKVLQQPTITTRAPAEEFAANPELYRWMLDHPDRVAQAWRRVGVEVAPIQDRGHGRFGWSDDKGSDVSWFPIFDGPQLRVWYGEGHVRAGALLQSVPVKAVVVLRHEADGSRVRHEVEAYATADSRAATVVAKLFGGSVESTAEMAATQMLAFFSVMSRYCYKHPDEADRLLAPVAVK